jgi:hypothetical protein
MADFPDSKDKTRPLLNRIGLKRKLKRQIPRSEFKVVTITDMRQESCLRTARISKTVLTANV